MNTEELKYDMKPHRLHLVLVLYQGNGTYIMSYVRSLICHITAFGLVWGFGGFCVVASVGWRGKSQIHNKIVSPSFILCQGLTVAQDGLVLGPSSFSPPQYWYYRHVPPPLAFPLFFERIFKGIENPVPVFAACCLSYVCWRLSVAL